MKSRKSQLVCQHLEHISGRLLEKFPSVVRAYIKHRNGVYALYKGGKLYYVGLAKDLRTRLKHHLRDRHAHRWDNFSIYLTIGDQHLKELESLVLRISSPDGNRQIGRFNRSENLWKRLDRQIEEQQRTERQLLLGLDTAEASESVLPAEKGRKARLAPYISKRIRIRWWHKGRIYKAIVRKDGRIRFRGRTFHSPSHAASSVTHRAMNGWSCWKYERAPGEWVVLDDLRHR